MYILKMESFVLSANQTSSIPIMKIGKEFNWIVNSGVNHIFLMQIVFNTNRKLYPIHYSNIKNGQTLRS